MGALILDDDIVVYDAESIDLFSVDVFAKLMKWKRTKIESKIRSSWTEGQEYVRTPDGDVLVSIAGFKAWARKHYTQEQGSMETESRSVSHGTVSAIPRSSGGSKRPPTNKRPVSFTVK